jgi:3-hydroxyisobutyrate dehydrogenase-like beta-hydroxyacid dehydrogenase
MDIGLIGLGLLGSSLAGRLLAGGFPVIGYDLNADRRINLEQIGGRAADSAQAVAVTCRRIVLSLPNSDIVASVVSEIAPQLREADVIIDTTTGDPEQTASLGRRLAGLRVRYLDAEIGGSSRQVRESDVIVLCGGEPEVYRQCADVFACFARRTFHLGVWGSGARMKLALNLVLGLNRAVLAEGLAFAEAMDFPPELALEIFQAGPAYSRAMDLKGNKMTTRDFTPEARLSQHLKDVRLILAAGERCHARLPLSTQHKQLLEEAESAGFGDADNSAVIELFRRRS